MWGLQIHGRSTHVHITLAAFYSSDRQTEQSYDKTGQLCTSTHSCSRLHRLRPPPPSSTPPPKTSPGFSYRHHTSNTHTPDTTHSPTLTPQPQPPSTCPLTTLRSHHPRQVHADPAEISAADGVGRSTTSSRFHHSTTTFS